MSADTEGRNKACCASCGTAEVDDIKLKDCSACYLVRYCGDECQKEHMAQRDHRPKDKKECQWGAEVVKYCGVKCQREHRAQHKRECKKRAAELRDEILFKQPESNHMGDCPICCLPLSIDERKCKIIDCCSKVICDGCALANMIRELEESLEQQCPFCRHPSKKSEEEIDRNFMIRVEARDPIAMRQIGGMRHEEGNYNSAFEYWSKAAELGDAGAHFHLAHLLYHEGKGVEKDEKKEVRHLEHAAIAGHPFARHHLGRVEWRNGRMDRAVKHWIIAANHGHDGALAILKNCYGRGLVSKEDFAAALRAHLAAVDATKSPHREEAELESLHKLRDARAGQSN